DAREALGRLALIFQVAPLKLRVSAIRLWQAADERRLVLAQRRQRFFEPVAAVRLRAFSRHGCPRPQGDTGRGCVLQSGRLDSNQRAYSPEPYALAKLSYAPSAWMVGIGPHRATSI